MHHLLDVNVLVAWGWADHLDHGRTVRWIVERKKARGSRLYTSAISELGFVRISVQRAGGRVTIQQASEVLGGMLKSLGKTHHFLADDLSSADPKSWPDWCQSASRSTDAHLLALARLHGLQLATLDTGIPGAMLVPAPAKTLPSDILTWEEPG